MLLEQRMKVVRRVLKWSCRIVTVIELQFCFMPEKGTIGVMLNLKMLKRRVYIVRVEKVVFCGPESFDRVPSSVRMGYDEYHQVSNESV